MNSTARCRKCGKRMKSERIDDYKVKFSCPCGFSEYETMPAASKIINPHFNRTVLSPIKVDESKGIVFEIERADRERMEIITLDELSMLTSSDYDLDDVLQSIVDKTAERLGVDICSVYIWDGGYMVLRASHGLFEAIGKARLRIGEGVTGSAVKASHPIFVNDIRQDSRYKYFEETKEEQSKIRSMLSYPIFFKGEPLGVLNAQTKEIREFKEDESHFVSIIANLILGAIRMRKRE